MHFGGARTKGYGALRGRSRYRLHYVAYSLSSTFAQPCDAMDMVKWITLHLLRRHSLCPSFLFVKMLR